MGSDLEKVLLTQEQIWDRLDELARQIWADYDAARSEGER